MNTEFWGDLYVVDLEKDFRTVFFYLLTCPSSTLAGCFQRHVKQISADTDIDVAIVRQAVDRFQSDGKIVYQDGWFVMLNFFKHNNLNDNMGAAAAKVLNAAPAWVGQRVRQRFTELGQDIPKWFIKHVRIIPEPFPNHSETIKGMEWNGIEGNLIEREGECAGAPTPEKKATLIPQNFSPDEKTLEFAIQNAPDVDIGRETHLFIQHYTQENKKGYDWQAGFRKWLLNAHGYQKERKQNGQSKRNSTATKTTDEVLAELNV